MNRYVGVIITLVAVAALIGAAIGWRFPFLGQNQYEGVKDQNVETANNTTQNRPQAQPTNRTTSQPNTVISQNRNNPPTATPSPSATVAPQAPYNQPTQPTNVAPPPPPVQQSPYPQTYPSPISGLW